MSFKSLITLIVGLVLGVVLTTVVAVSAAPKIMIVEDQSNFDFDTTIEMIRTSARENEWKIPTVHMLHDAVAPYGYQVDRVAVIELCQPHHAAKILAEDASRSVTSLMPCRVSVYETADGRVIVSRMNTGLIAQVFGGTIAEVMAEATQDNEKILTKVLR